MSDPHVTIAYPVFEGLEEMAAAAAATAGSTLHGFDVVTTEAALVSLELRDNSYTVGMSSNFFRSGAAEAIRLKRDSRVMPRRPFSEGALSPHPAAARAVHSESELMHHGGSAGPDLVLHGSRRKSLWGRTVVSVESTTSFLLSNVDGRRRCSPAPARGGWSDRADAASLSGCRRRGR